jgi:uncharacterized protein
MNPAAEQQVRRRFEAALTSFLAKVERDPYVIAVILAGSLSHDTVWEKSDIDLFIVTEETRQKRGEFCLVEDGINIHAYPVPRGEFRRLIEGSLQSSFLHSTLNKGKLVFTRDETLRDLFEASDRLGARDREIRLLQAASCVLPALAKAEKWLHAKGDVDYSFFWIMKCLDGLATVETLLAGELTGREVIHQALRHNPEFFGAVYTDLIRGPRTEAAVREALERIQGYLRERIPLLFKPILDHLAASGGVRSATELDHHFKNQMNLEGLASAYEWLADEEVIRKLAAPVRLTEKSRVDVDEAAYYYEGDPA